MNDNNANDQSTLSGFNHQFIGGDWRTGASESVVKNTNPYDSSSIVDIQAASKDDVDEAYRRAAEAQRAWAAKTPSERAGLLLNVAKVLEKRHDEIVDWLVQESGSTRLKAEMEWGFTYDSAIEAARLPYLVNGTITQSDVPGKENRTYREPLGTVLVISPWNFPLYLTHRSLGPALALGNAVVVKPASDTPVTGGLLLAKIYEEAGLPAGLLSVVVGRGSEIGDYVVQHDAPSLVSFTGSTPVGKHVGELAASGPRLKKTALELGGNAPLVVLDDADIEAAVEGALFGRFLHQGQICMSTNRLIVDDAVYDEFVTAFAERTGKLVSGDPNEQTTLIGPIINKSQLDDIVARVDQAKKDGHREVAGGRVQGNVVTPHVFVDVDRHSPLATEESFGPIVPVIRAHGEEDALDIANDTEFGLSSAVYTRDPERGAQFARRVEAGMTHVNDVTVEDEPGAPFGGEKNSGIGRFHGESIVDELTTQHWISIQHTRRQYPLV